MRFPRMHPLSKKLRSHYVPFEFIPFKSHHSRVSLFPGVLNVTKPEAIVLVVCDPSMNEL